MATIGQYRGPSAPYPNVGYPASDFFGVQSTSNTSPAANLASAPRQAVAGLIPGVLQKHAIITLVVVVIGGYALWHVAQKYG